MADKNLARPYKHHTTSITPIWWEMLHTKNTLTSQYRNLLTPYVILDPNPSRRQ
jgi:hypothetical protein